MRQINDKGESLYIDFFFLSKNELGALFNLVINSDDTRDASSRYILKKMPPLPVSYCLKISGKSMK